MEAMWARCEERLPRPGDPDRDGPFLDLPSAYGRPGASAPLRARVKYPSYQCIRRARVTLRWRGSAPRTDTTHCPKAATVQARWSQDCSARVFEGSAPWAAARDEWANCLSCGPDLVYPRFFHGSVFQAVGAFGREGGGLRAALAPGLPSLGWGCGPTALRPRLLELVLQCCGLQELAETGRKMVPAGLEAVHWLPASLTADDGTSAMALAWPRSGQQNGAAGLAAWLPSRCFSRWKRACPSRSRPIW